MSKFVALLIFCLTPLFVQSKISYSRHEAMIPMRDGVKLYTVYFTPEGINEAVPILIRRTPYSSEHGVSPDTMDYLKDMAADGYIFVSQDVRGRYKSEGRFLMNGPVLDKPGMTDESTDTYDAIDWLLKNVPNNNGKVGLFGISYLGWTTVIGAARPHPALKAACDQACMSDLFLGDDFHHNGAFRLSYAFDYCFMEECNKVDTLFEFDEHDMYSWFLKLGPLGNANAKYFHDRLPSWNLFMNHPNYDSFWQFKSPLRYASIPRVPTLHVGGVWDQEDIMGPQLMYATQEKLDTYNRNFICLGPWNHGQWRYGNISKLGNYDMGSNTSHYFLQNIQRKWFGRWLKGKEGDDLAEATVFQTGSNQWKTYTSWPPREVTTKKLYTAENRKVSFTKPVATSAAYDEYISDPKQPVPYRPRPIEQTYGQGSRWFTWLTDDQRFVDNRPDVLTWESDELTDSLVVTGQIKAHIAAATTGSDADWVVKLIDVYPDQYEPIPSMGGYQLMIATEVFRGRFRESFEHPKPITPGKVEDYTIDLHQVNHVFKKGHHIMIQVQSSWFPIIDMNPQKYVPSIYEAKSADYIKATQRIYRSGEHATYIELPVMN